MTHLVTSAAVADACDRLSVPLRAGPAGLTPVLPGHVVVGTALPVKHVDGVDVFLDAFERARPGEVLVVDDGGRTDRACLGDLIAAEATVCELAGMVVWGSHRDTDQLREIGLPVWSLGAIATGTTHTGQLSGSEVLFDAYRVDETDLVVADSDGVVLVAAETREKVLETAREIMATEARQAERIRTGQSLRAQLQYADFAARRRSDPTYTFRDHLRAVRGAI
ncbi:RraA family protein [Haloechinothrix halophila]|uniref:RraA family protein n=1 Tax=Haloechinothrix halophila TaxID=1069073 RepID=UPI00054EE2A5|nr:hypothetical protein [Haloechinothrix halophila]